LATRSPAQWTDELTDALEGFQTHLGVEPTGTVDSATITPFEDAIATTQETPSPSPTPEPRRPLNPPTSSPQQIVTLTGVADLSIAIGRIADNLEELRR
jgi:hypothetical protein